MNFAICISGALRGNYKKAFDSIYKNLVTPLNADVFIETWDNFYEWPGICSGDFIQRIFGDDIFKKTPGCISNEKLFKEKMKCAYAKLSQPIVKKIDIAEINNLYSNAFISVNSEQKFTEDILVQMDTSGKFLPNQYRMFYLMYRANSNMHVYEKSTLKKYDVIVRVRPDVFFEESPNIQQFYELQDNEALIKSIHWGLDDVYFCAKSDTMDKIMCLWEKVVLCRKLSPFKTYKYRSHPLLTLWTCFKRVEVKPFDYKVNLQSVLDDFLPDITNEIQYDCQILKSMNDPDFEKIRNWCFEIEKKFGLKKLVI